jgi:hypothetical protein
LQVHPGLWFNLWDSEQAIDCTTPEPNMKIILKKAATTLLATALFVSFTKPAMAGYSLSGITGQSLFVVPCATGSLGCPDPAPIQTFIAVFSIVSKRKGGTTEETSELVADIKTDEAGHFEIALKPGTYVLVPHLTPDIGDPTSNPVGILTTATVQKKQFTRVAINYVSR